MRGAPFLALPAVLTALVATTPARAQHEHETRPPDTRQAPETAREHPEHDHHPPEHALFPGTLGPYDAGRDASGTAWQPASSGHEGIHMTGGAWQVMVHGFALPAWTHQGSERGDDDLFASTMAMSRAVRRVGPGRLTLRTMLSLDPATIGAEGYPVLLQTGETSDGSTPLIDRQHPHDLFMELAASYALLGRGRSLFLYAGLPGEPALGPPVFMHRRSGVDIPEAPIGHHWLDSSHITYGAVTLGAMAGGWKLEASAFRGREPDHERWDIEEPELDSHSFRLSWNPGPDWALQASYGRLESPEELHSEVDTDRTTASLIYNRPAARGNWQTTIAWGRNRNRPGRILDAFLIESALTVATRHTFLGRFEVADKDELFEEGDPLHGPAHTVSKLGLGYLVDVLMTEHVAWGLGAYGTVSGVPDEIEAAYGDDLLSGTLFTRLKLR